MTISTSPMMSTRDTSTQIMTWMWGWWTRRAKATMETMGTLILRAARTVRTDMGLIWFHLRSLMMAGAGLPQVHHVPGQIAPSQNPRVAPKQHLELEVPNGSSLEHLSSRQQPAVVPLNHHHGHHKKVDRPKLRENVLGGSGPPKMVTWDSHASRIVGVTA